MSDRVLDYLQANRDDLLEKLLSFLSIPSVSTDSDIKKISIRRQTLLLHI